MSNFVLVHGGFCGGWYWKKVKVLLENAGHTVFTPTLTGLGERNHLNNPNIDLNTHILDITNLCVFQDIKDAILVGHSYGGLVITGVASAMPDRIKKLIYLDGLIPDVGDSLMSLVDDQTAFYFRSQVEEKGEGWFVPASLSASFADDDNTWFNERVTTQAFKSFEQEIIFDPTIVNAIPKSFISCAQNDHITLKNMARKARAKGWPYYEIDSDHFPMISNPVALSEVLQEQSQA
jgi:pimeloyl-ACP methyl ester carboxylesterase